MSSPVSEPTLRASVRGNAILLVDDSSLTRQLIRSKLVRNGYRVVEATNGVEALDVLEQERPGLIVTDIEMPEMDGFTLIEQLRATDETRNLPVIVLSTRASAADRSRAETLGVVGYLVKPELRDEELFALVSRFVSSPTG